jgi:hypothetical protein
MKKTLAILALALFIGGTSATAIAANIDTPVAIELREDDKKKAAKSEKKTEATKKSSDCAKSCEGEKKSDCSKSCEGESKK